jgi:L-seryl-tRNA(Ser) seleniumtransferase
VSSSISLRDLPSIGALLDDGSVRERFGQFPRKMLVEAMRRVVAQWRNLIRQGTEPPCGVSRVAFLGQVELMLSAMARHSLRPVINATGVILNTNLGRAPLAGEVVQALSRVAAGYCNLETELRPGTRGHRMVHVEGLLIKLTGAPAAMVVNNNAAAVLLVLNTFAKGREVIVSRGELIEIGGSFRLPEVMASSGAQLVEVGTTNRTYLEDYQRAITEVAAMLFRSHTSNYRVVGFTARPSLQELVQLGRRRRLLTVEDLGSGLLAGLEESELGDEPSVAEAVKSGVDLITFSGDKLLGGPQCGIILGRQRLITRLRRNPLARAIRVGKLTLAALEAVLRLYAYADLPAERLPHLKMILQPVAEVRRRAKRLLSKVQPLFRADLEAKLVDGFSAVGGGSYPGAQVPTCLIGLRASGFSPTQMAQKLRMGDPPVLGRIAGNRFLLDLRTVMPGEMTGLRRALVRLCEEIRAV